jgi:hypothetical protein
MSDTKFWTLLLSTGFTDYRIDEYNITSLQPFTISAVQRSWSFNNSTYSGLNFQTNFGLNVEGFCYKSENKLLLGSKALFEVDITTTGATFTNLFNLSYSGAFGTDNFGEILYNPTTNRFTTIIIKNSDYTTTFLAEYGLDGTLWNANQLQSFGTNNIPSGLFVNSNVMYLTSYADGNLYSINQTTLVATYNRTIPPLSGFTGITINGVAQRITCNNQSLTQTPTPTPTPTSVTPTPTPTTSYELYTADRYTCDTTSGPCTYVETLQIANPTVLIEGKFYLDAINGYIFNIVGGPISGPYLYTSMSGLGTNNCSSLCNI